VGGFIDIDIINAHAGTGDYLELFPAWIISLVTLV